MFEKNQSDEGVSPVVGVILMVAITVILSAIIATFVLDLGGTVSQNPQAGVTFDQDATANTVDVQVVSMENADTVDIAGVSGGASVSTAFPNPASVGDTATVSGADGDTGKITVTATLEGKTQVIQTFSYEF